jgi:hypothetical protein
MNFLSSIAGTFSNAIDTVTSFQLPSVSSVVSRFAIGVAGTITGALGFSSVADFQIPTLSDVTGDFASGITDTFDSITSGFKVGPPHQAPMVAKVFLDLAKSQSAAPAFYVVEFFQGDKEKSDYLAIPAEYFSKDGNGKVTLNVYDSADDNFQTIGMTADVVEDDAVMHDTDVPNLPPFVGPELYSGKPCLYTDDKEGDIVDACQDVKTEIYWGGDEDDMDPDEPSHLGETVELPNIPGVDNSDLYVPVMHAGFGHVGRPVNSI